MTYDDQRIRDLADHVEQDLNLQRQYEDQLRLEEDPKRRTRIMGEIATLAESADRYHRELNSLQQRTHLGPRTAEQIHARIDELASRQQSIEQNVSEIQHLLLTGINDQTGDYSRLIGTVLPRLTPAQLEEVQQVAPAILQGVETNVDAENALSALKTTVTEALAYPNALPPDVAAELTKLPAVFETPKMDVKQKLKITIPLIPFLISWDTEVEFKSSANLAAAWHRLLTWSRKHHNKSS